MKRLLSILCLLAVAVTAAAQASISVSVQNIVALDEQFNVTFTIEGESRPSDFNWEPGSNFQLVWGPQKGTSTSISITNGKKTQTSQTTYTYVLMPTATGTFTIPAATAKVKGQTISSQPATVQVVGGGAQGSQGSSGSAAPSSGQTQQVAGEDLFLRLTVSKTKAVVGETINATLKLYSRVNIAGFEDARFPSFNGFWSQEVQAPQNIEFHRETISDQIYDAALLRSWTIIPQQSGEIAIDPAELVCLVNVRSRRSTSGSIFDSFFQDDYTTVRRRISTKPITVSVARIPEGAPASFGGGVGQFKMNASLTRDSLQTHDAASLKITVSGKGNVSLLEAPKVNFPPDFELYDVKTSEQSGSKTFEYPFIPRSHGNFTIGPIEYSYYDASERRFVTLRSEAMQIKVGRSTESPATLQGGQSTVVPLQKGVKDLGSDIRYISTRKPSFTKAGYFFVGSPLFWILAALLCAIAAAVYFGTRSVAARRADVVGSRRSAATKMARRRLSQANEFLQKDLYTAFYEELHKALLGFVGDKLNLPAAELNKDNISDKLVAGGATPEQAARFVELLDACEFARYAPSEGHEAMNAHYEGAVAVISEIDSAMKKNPSGGSGRAAAIALLVALLPFGAQAAAPADSLWTEGVNAYSEGRWADARDAWTGIAAQGLESAELYYNIGNACFKEEDIAHAVLWYERALKADPSFDDARFNLEFARSRVMDRIEEVPEFFLEQWGRKACWLLPSGTWAVLGLVFLAATLAMLLLFLLGHGAARKAGFFTGIATLLLTLLCLDFAFWQRTDALRHNEAVVTVPVTEVKSSPGSGVSLFVLHEGTKVKLLENVGTWTNVELADGRQGWMETGTIEII